MEDDQHLRHKKALNGLLNSGRREQLEDMWANQDYPTKEIFSWMCLPDTPKLKDLLRKKIGPRVSGNELHPSVWMISWPSTSRYLRLSMAVGHLLKKSGSGYFNVEENESGQLIFIASKQGGFKITNKPPFRCRSAKLVRYLRKKTGSESGLIILNKTSEMRLITTDFLSSKYEREGGKFISVNPVFHLNFSSGLHKELGTEKFDTKRQYINFGEQDGSLFVWPGKSEGAIPMTKSGSISRSKVGRFFSEFYEKEPPFRLSVLDVDKNGRRELYLMEEDEE